LIVPEEKHNYKNSVTLKDNDESSPDRLQSDEETPSDRDTRQNKFRDLFLGIVLILGGMVLVVFKEGPDDFDLGKYMIGAGILIAKQINVKRILELFRMYFDK
jgi:hypothetical protein